MRVREGNWNPEYIERVNELDSQKLAVVGCGPRGLYCLERLADEISKSEEACAIDVTIFEPCSWPGAGLVYDLEQPEYLIINYKNEHIDTWNLRSKRRGQSLNEWLSDRHPKYLFGSGYVPRAVAGEYLYECFTQVIRELQLYGSVRIIKDKVRRLYEKNGDYSIETDKSVFCFDHVVITTGHEGWRPPSGFEEGRATEEIVVEHVFPVKKMLSERSIRPKDRVGIRGFSLSFIDAALALTEGRGGEFYKTNTGLKYSGSGLEPLHLYPFCRSGRPMLCKPESQMMRIPKAVEEVWNDGRARINAIRRKQDSVSFDNDIWPIVLYSADQALSFCGQNVAGGALSWFRIWNRIGNDSRETLQFMKQACRVASGEIPVDAAWALAESWRRLYSSVAIAIGRGGLRRAEWDSFRNISKEMERIAFGPPLLNLRKVIALIEAGIVNLRALRSPNVFPVNRGYLLSKDGWSTRIDRLVNSVIPGPQDFAPDSLLRMMLDQGLARSVPGSGAVEVGISGELVNKDRFQKPNLSLFGRATEGWILGNDSLSRSPGDEISRWAENLVGSLPKFQRVNARKIDL